jgi:hypothetical protein
MALFFLLPFGCANYTGSEIGQGESSPFEEVSDLFQDTSGGIVVLETNDKNYLGPRGYTLWALRGAGNNPFIRKEVDVIKQSGNLYAGYGILFCHEVSGLDESMLFVMINTQKEYMAGKVINGDVEYIKEWTTFNYLSAGIGMTNKIVVTRDNSGIFAIELNGVDTGTRFQDSKAGGREGYIAVIAPNDDFVYSSVRIEYQE